MKAKELMIGDWVLNNAPMPPALQEYETQRVNKPMKVDNLWSIAINVESKGAHGAIYYDDAEPIPLTFDILKANGWKVNKAYWTLFLDDWSHLEFYWYEHRLRKYWQGVDEWQNHHESRELVFQCNCSYVHELQHALRLCKLDELADNFKMAL